MKAEVHEALSQPVFTYSGPVASMPDDEYEVTLKELCAWWATRKPRIDPFEPTVTGATYSYWLDRERRFARGEFRHLPVAQRVSEWAHAAEMRERLELEE